MSQHLVVIKSESQSDLIDREQQKPHRVGEYPDNDATHGIVYTSWSQKYGRVLCDARTLDKRFYQDAIDQFEQLYEECKAKMEAKEAYKSHPVFTVENGYRYVAVSQLMEPEIHKLAVKFADIVTNPENTTSQRLGWNHRTTNH